MKGSYERIIRNVVLENSIRKLYKSITCETYTKGVH